MRRLFIIATGILLLTGITMNVSATPIRDIGYQDYVSRLGVDTSFDLMKIEPGQSVSGVVKDAGVLKKAGGPSGIKAGDTVIFHHLGDGRFRLSFPRFENENTINVKFGHD